MSAQIRSFRDLDAWNAAMELMELTYRFTARLPATERFGLISQMRRAAVSIPSNIAEGHAVRLPRWGLRHFTVASGSIAELDTQHEAAIRLALAPREGAQDFEATITRVRQLVYGLRRNRERKLQISAGVVTVVIVLVLAFAIAGFN
jgi:four helix bundle protein